MRKNRFLCFSAIVFLFIVVLASPLFAGGESEGDMVASTIRYAAADQPPHLDQHVLTSDLSTTVAQHIFEGLFTFDANYAPVPLLASDYQIEQNGLYVRISLRQGVRFHDGSTFDADDAVASLERWGEFGVRGPVLFNNISLVERISQYEIGLRFRAPFAPWINLLAFINGGPTMYPSEVVAGADENPIPQSQYIGTGPYRFEEWQDGRFIRLTRYEDYVSAPGEANGYAGERVANVEELLFIPVPDPNTRISGLRAGDYDYAEDIPGDLYTSLQSDPEVRVIVKQAPNQGLLFFNSNGGIFQDNPLLRQAVRSAIDFEEVLQAAIGPDGLWDANGAIMPRQTIWYNESGIVGYPEQDIDQARQLAQRAGYNGEPIRYVTSHAFQWHLDSSTVIVRHLEAAGINVDLQVYDWPGLSSRRGDPEQWDIFVTHHGPIPDPILYSFLSETYPGWWATDEITDLKAQFSSTTDQQQRLAIWGEIQRLVYEQTPVIKTGDVFSYNIYSPNLTGLGDSSLIWPNLWGTQIR